ncbi:MAG: hypothetical protein DMG59_01400 [Acidobacteria bacterium]|jgi:hypothetical protein|nr:MAG: hypothetical protein DMG59_01400 [Acidobacteriota bacterium]
MIATALIAQAGERKPLPGQAGNDDIEMVASVLIDRDEIHQALGADLGAGYVAVRIKVTPKTEQPLRVSPDDFTMISRKDGQRSVALSPGQVAGKGALVVKAAPSQPGGFGTQSNGPIWGGIGGPPQRLPGSGGGIGNMAGADGGAEAKVEPNNKAKDNPLLAILKEKSLPDKETKEPVEGLLYFPIEGKVKPKDLAVLYKGPAGKLVMEFK